MKLKKLNWVSGLCSEVENQTTQVLSWASYCLFDELRLELFHIIEYTPSKGLDKRFQVITLGFSNYKREDLQFTSMAAAKKWCRKILKEKLETLF